MPSQSRHIDAWVPCEVIAGDPAKEGMTEPSLLVICALSRPDEPAGDVGAAQPAAG